MNILYRTIYKIELNGRKIYNTVYSLHNTAHFPMMNADEMSRELAESLVSETVSIHFHGRADINGEVKGHADGLVSFDLSIDNHEIFTEHNRVDLKGFLEWVGCEGGPRTARRVKGLPAILFRSLWMRLNTRLKLMNRALRRLRLILMKNSNGCL